MWFNIFWSILHRGTLHQRPQNRRETFWSGTSGPTGQTVFTTCVSWTLMQSPIGRGPHRNVWRRRQRVRSFNVAEGKPPGTYSSYPFLSPPDISQGNSPNMTLHHCSRHACREHCLSHWPRGTGSECLPSVTWPLVESPPVWCCHWVRRAGISTSSRRNLGIWGGRCVRERGWMPCPPDPRPRHGAHCDALWRGRPYCSRGRGTIEVVIIYPLLMVNTHMLWTLVSACTAKSASAYQSHMVILFIFNGRLTYIFPQTYLIVFNNFYQSHSYGLFNLVYKNGIFG